jgi:hypothetical protein
MGKVIPFDAARPFSNQTAMQRIRQMWVEDNYVPSPHAEDRMLERGFSDGDIEHLVMLTGRVSSHRKVDGQWRYKVSGKSVDGKRMAAIFEVQGSCMTLVTVHDR